MSRVHHVFVRDRASGVWAHETAFADRRDAEAERDDYRDKPTTRAVRIIAGPGAGEAHFAWIARQVAVLNGPTTTAPGYCALCNAAPCSCLKVTP